NGEFRSWPSPLRQIVTHGRVDVSEHWAVVCNAESPAVEIRLTELAAHGGEVDQQASGYYGLALVGHVEGNHLRLEADLDKHRLAAAKAKFLMFYARRASPASSANAPSQGADGTINQISVIDRRVIAGGGSEPAFE